MVRTLVVVVVGILVLRKLWQLPPALSMCAAIALTVFSGGWSQMGLPGAPLNRLLIAFVILQILLRAPGTIGMPQIQIRNVHLLMGLTVLYALGSAAASGALASKSGFLQLFDVFGVTSRSYSSSSLPPFLPGGANATCCWSRWSASAPTWG